MLKMTIESYDRSQLTNAVSKVLFGQQKAKVPGTWRGIAKLDFLTYVGLVPMTDGTAPNKLSSKLRCAAFSNRGILCETGVPPRPGHWYEHFCSTTAINNHDQDTSRNLATRMIPRYQAKENRRKTGKMPRKKVRPEQNRRKALVKQHKKSVDRAKASVTRPKETCVPTYSDQSTSFNHFHVGFPKTTPGGMYATPKSWPVVGSLRTGGVEVQGIGFTGWRAEGTGTNSMQPSDIGSSLKDSNGIATNSMGTHELKPRGMWSVFTESNNAVAAGTGSHCMGSSRISSSSIGSGSVGSSGIQSGGLPVESMQQCNMVVSPACPSQLLMSQHSSSQHVASQLSAHDLSVSQLPTRQPAIKSPVTAMTATKDTKQSEKVSAHTIIHHNGVMIGYMKNPIEPTNTVVQPSRKLGRPRLQPRANEAREDVLVDIMYAQLGETTPPFRAQSSSVLNIPPKVQQIFKSQFSLLPNNQGKQIPVLNKQGQQFNQEQQVNQEYKTLNDLGQQLNEGQKLGARYQVFKTLVQPSNTGQQVLNSLQPANQGQQVFKNLVQPSNRGQQVLKSLQPANQGQQVFKNLVQPSNTGQQVLKSLQPANQGQQLFNPVTLAILNETDHMEGLVVSTFIPKAHNNVTKKKRRPQICKPNPKKAVLKAKRQNQLKSATPHPPVAVDRGSEVSYLLQRSLSLLSGPVSQSQSLQAAESVFPDQSDNPEQMPPLGHTHLSEGSGGGWRDYWSSASPWTAAYPPPAGTRQWGVGREAVAPSPVHGFYKQSQSQMAQFSNLLKRDPGAFTKSGINPSAIVYRHARDFQARFNQSHAEYNSRLRKNHNIFAALSSECALMLDQRYDMACGVPNSAANSANKRPRNE